MTERLARWRVVVASVVVLGLAATLLVATPAQAEPARPIRPDRAQPVSVPGKAGAQPVRQKPGTEEATFLRAAPPAGQPAAVAAPSGVHAEVLDQNTARHAGVPGLLLRVSSGQVRVATVEVDYAGMRHAYGGDWASRLQVVRVHDGKVFPGHNDLKNGKLRVELPVPGTKPPSVGLLADGEPEPSDTLSLTANGTIFDGAMPRSTEMLVEGTGVHWTVTVVLTDGRSYARSGYTGRCD